jgi:predicted ATP-grasp superfamily ATP-dependent carboligase
MFQSSTTKPHVMVTEGALGQSRAAVTAVRLAAESGRSASVTSSSTLTLAAASRFAARVIRVPAIADDRSGYIAAVRRELTQRPYISVLPASDAAILALDCAGSELVSKTAMMRNAEAAGLKVPPSATYQTKEVLLDSAASLRFPVIVKPNIKSALASYIRNPEDIAALQQNSFPAVVQPYISDPMHGVVGLMWEGALVLAAHMDYQRTWPARCGTVSAARTTRADTQLEDGLAQLLDGYNGLFHVDMAGPYLLDVNPRVHATLALARRAGLNLVGSYCDLREGARVKPARAASGFAYRWIEGDIRSVVAAVRRGNVGARSGLRSLRPHAGTAHSLDIRRDPGPLVARVAYVVNRLASKAFRATTRVRSSPRADQQCA